MESNSLSESEGASRAAAAPDGSLRRVSRLDTTAPPAPGFIGEGHTAVAVVAPDDLAASDPFVLLMDDRLDIARRRVIGGAHPHAGIETVTLVLEGTLVDRDEGALGAGDLVWMTAGRGIIHNESVEAFGRSRILQLWIALPAKDRELSPRFEIVRRDAAPVVRAAGVEGRLYSGSAGALRSPTRNRVPVTLLDLSLAPGATFLQDLPGSYNGFAYVIDGSVTIGETVATAGQVAWFSPDAGGGALELSAEGRGGRLVLYAGQTIDEPLVHHGPFVAGSPFEIAELHRRFRAGQFESMHALGRAERERALPRREARRA